MKTFRSFLPLFFLYTFPDPNAFALDFKIQHICLLLFFAKSLQSPFSASLLLSATTEAMCKFISVADHLTGNNSFP